MHRRCVFTAAGDRNAVRQWLPPEGERAFDLLVAFHGEDDTRFAGLCEIATRVWRIKGSKMQSLRALVQAGEIDLSAYSHVWLPDDGLQIDPEDIPRLFDLATAYDFWVSQPAFAEGSRTSWPVTRVAETREQIRLTTFVEGTCPLFRRDKLETFLATYDGSLVDWGIDWWFAHELGAAWSGRFAVIDAITALNPEKRSGTTDFRDNDRRQGADERRAAWFALRDTRGIGMAKAETLAQLPLPPGWRASKPLGIQAVPEPEPAAKPMFGHLAMSTAEAELFRAAIAPQLSCYVEWGIGGSTQEALRSPTRRIISIESDAARIDAARSNSDIRSAEEGGRLNIVHAGVEPNRRWGVATTGSATTGVLYADAPWELLRARGDWPAVVLVNGRFRVACALAVAREAMRHPGASPPLLLLHDVGPQRRHYGPVFQAWRTEISIESLHLLRLRPGLDIDMLDQMVVSFADDPR